MRNAMTEDHAQRRTLGELIRTHRLQRGWSQTELGDRVGQGMTQSDVSKLERGAVDLPHRKRMEALADVMGLSLGKLLAASGWDDADTLVADGPEVTVIPVPAASWRGQLLTTMVDLTDQQLEIVASVVDGIKRSGLGADTTSVVGSKGTKPTQDPKTTR